MNVVPYLGWYKKVCDLILRKRLHDGLAQKDVADQMGIGINTLRRIEHGKAQVNLRSFLLAANCSGMKMCEDMKEIGRRLAAYRVYRGMSQKELAKSLETSATSINAYELGSTYPSIDIFLWICAELEADVGVLLKK